jgi:hypothetical protein
MDLKTLLQPQQNKFEKFILRIDGQPKTGKSTLAYTASRMCPPPAQWDPRKPVALTDIMGIQFEPNSNMYLAEKGVTIPNMLDWSDPRLTWAALKPAIKALPGAAQQYRDQGITTIVIDTLSSFNRFLLREIIEKPTYERDMDRVRAYGFVDEAHYLLFDMLNEMSMNIIALVHLQAFLPFGEDGNNADFNKQAEKQEAKLEANQVQGMRTTFIPNMRPKPAGRWALMADAVLVAKPEMKTVRAGVEELKYKFIAKTDGEFAAGGRWAVPDINDAYLRPIIESRYNSNTNNNGSKT